MSYRKKLSQAERAPPEQQGAQAGTQHAGQKPKLRGPESPGLAEHLDNPTGGEGAMKIRDVMSRDVEVARPDDSIQEIALKMGRLDVGAFPVGESDRLVGMVTDRDIAVRAVGAGRDPSTRVRDVMSAEVKYCFEDEDVTHVSKNMAELQVRRLPVVDRDKRLVGIVSLGDIAKDEAPEKAGHALRGVSRQSEQHSQRAQAGSKPTASRGGSKKARADQVETLGTGLEGSGGGTTGGRR